jgi:hypothetical protein
MSDSAVYRRGIAIAGAAGLVMLLWATPATAGAQPHERAVQTVATVATDPVPPVGFDGATDPVPPVGFDGAAESLAPAQAEGLAPAQAEGLAPAQAEGLAPAQPAGPETCSNGDIKVQVQAGAASYKVGQKPRFTLTITNTGDDPCTRDLDRGLQEVVVTKGGDRVWSSNDCYPASRTNVRTLQPKVPVVSPVVWSGRTSQPGCTGTRTAVGPGTYKVRGKLGKLDSDGVEFKIVP